MAWRASVRGGTRRVAFPCTECSVPGIRRQRTVAVGGEGANLDGQPMTLLIGNLAIAAAVSLVAVVTV